jgi:hypothetical protein
VVAKNIWKMIKETFACIHMDDFSSFYNIWLSNDHMGWKWLSMLMVWDRATSMLRSGAPFPQRIVISVDGQKPTFAGYQAGGFADCVMGLKTDAKCRQYLIANTTWFKPA